MKTTNLALVLTLASSAAIAEPPEKNIEPILLASNVPVAVDAIRSIPAIVPASRANRVLAETLGVVSTELAAHLQARYGLESDPLKF